MEGGDCSRPYHARIEGSIIREVAALLPSTDGEGKADVVSEITAHLLPFVSCGRYKYWNKILHALARHPRPHFLVCYASCANLYVPLYLSCEPSSSILHLVPNTTVQGNGKP